MKLTTPTRIHLIRHGQVHNPAQILYGRMPRFRLTAAGRRQAQTAGRHLNGMAIEALYSSPLLRARQTAREILSHVNSPQVHISTLLNEVCTVYEGRPGAEIDDRNGDVYTGAAACFEQPADVVARTRKFIRNVRRRHPGGRIAAVTHGDIITFIVLWAKDMAPTPQNKNRLLKAGYPSAYPAHASVTTLTFHTEDEQERPEVDYLQPYFQN
jgi:broad specificity phosphatase PhoE